MTEPRVSIFNFESGNVTLEATLKGDLVDGVEHSLDHAMLNARILADCVPCLVHHELRPTDAVDGVCRVRARSKLTVGGLRCSFKVTVELKLELVDTKAMQAMVDLIAMSFITELDHRVTSRCALDAVNNLLSAASKRPDKFADLFQDLAGTNGFDAKRRDYSHLGEFDFSRPSYDTDHMFGGLGPKIGDTRIHDHIGLGDLGDVPPPGWGDMHDVLDHGMRLEDHRRRDRDRGPFSSPTHR